MSNALMGRSDFKLYPRGFLGAPQGPKIEKMPRPFDEQLSRVQTQFSLLRPTESNSLVPNQNVESLYSEYINNGARVLDFDFRKRVLITALNAFGTTMFDMWYQKQTTSPAFGDLHSQFIDDTLRFIADGKREMSVETWGSLLTYSDKGELHREVSEYAAEFFGISTRGYNRHRRNATLVEIIQQWTSKPNGFEDLLCTLHVLFGTY